MQIEVGGRYDFTHGDGLLQSFDIHPPEVPRNCGIPNGGCTTINDGYVSSHVNRNRFGFGFVIDHIRVTPKVCKP